MEPAGPHSASGDPPDHSPKTAISSISSSSLHGGSPSEPLIIKQPSSSSLFFRVETPLFTGRRWPIGEPELTNGCVAELISRPLIGEMTSCWAPGSSGSVIVATISPSSTKLPAGARTSRSPPWSDLIHTDPEARILNLGLLGYPGSLLRPLRRLIIPYMEI